MRTTEDLYADMEIAQKLRLSRNPEVIDALNSDYENDGLSIDENGLVWGNEVDTEKFEDTPLTIRTQRTMGFMGS